MSCTSPRFRVDVSQPGVLAMLPSYLTGKVINGGILFGREHFDDYAKFLPLSYITQIACGQCMYCRIKSSREKSFRCYAESLYHPFNYFVTLTYNDQFLPRGDFVDAHGAPVSTTLRLDDMQKFNKRVRKNLGTMKTFYCGEYGDLFNRPHYHSLMFCDFELDDLEFVYRKGGFDYFHSNKLSSCWTDPTSDVEKGFVVISEFNFTNAAYCTKYILKKQRSDVPAIMSSGKQLQEQPFAQASRRPGLGFQYFKDHSSEIYASDRVLYQKNYEVFRMKPPKYYDSLFDEVDSDALQIIKDRRHEVAKISAENRMLSVSESYFARLDRENDMSLRKERRRMEMQL